MLATLWYVEDSTHVIKNYQWWLSALWLGEIKGHWGLLCEPLCLNVSTTPLRQWGFWHCLPFSWTILNGKHCRHPIAVMVVVDTFWPCMARWPMSPNSRSNKQTYRMRISKTAIKFVILDYKCIVVLPFTSGSWLSWK